MKTIRAIVCAVAIVCLGACNPSDWKEVKTVSTDVVTDAEIACQAAIALGLDNATLLEVCKDVSTYSPLVNAVIAARANPDASNALVAARLSAAKAAK